MGHIVVNGFNSPVNEEDLHIGWLTDQSVTLCCKSRVRKAKNSRKNGQRCASQRQTEQGLLPQEEFSLRVGGVKAGSGQTLEAAVL